MPDTKSSWARLRTAAMDSYGSAGTSPAARTIATASAALEPSPDPRGIVLSIFCGFFLYIGASDLLPESHHRHPKVLTGIMNILGATVIWLAIHFATF